MSCSVTFVAGAYVHNRSGVPLVVRQVAGAGEEEATRKVLSTGVDLDVDTCQAVDVAWGDGGDGVW